MFHVDLVGCFLDSQSLGSGDSFWRHHQGQKRGKFDLFRNRKEAQADSNMAETWRCGEDSKGHGQTEAGNKEQSPHLRDGILDGEQAGDAKADQSLRPKDTERVAPAEAELVAVLGIPGNRLAHEQAAEKDGRGHGGSGRDECHQDEFQQEGDDTAEAATVALKGGSRNIDNTGDLRQ